MIRDVVKFGFAMKLIESILPEMLERRKREKTIEADLQLSIEAKKEMALGLAVLDGKTERESAYIMAFIDGYNQQWKEMKEKEELK